MKLALVISSLSAGGAERVLTNMANYWCTAGKEVVLITFSAGDEDDFYPINAGIRRVCLDFRRNTQGWADKLKFNVSRLVALRRALDEFRPDVVVSFMDSTNVLTVLSAVGRKHATILSVRNNPKYRRLPLIWQVGRHLTYRFATTVVAQTKGAAEWIRIETGSKVSVIPNPVQAVTRQELAREQIILAVGRLIPEKGHDLLLDAFSRIVSKFPDWRLIILGEGPLRSQLQDQIDRAGLSQRVEMPGTVKDVDTWISRCGLYAHPSRSEGFPNALIEAMAAGAPVLGCNCDFGPGEIIQNDVSGILVPAEDAAEFASALERLLSDKELRTRLGQAAMSVRYRYEITQIMQRWDALLQ